MQSAKKITTNPSNVMAIAHSAVAGADQPVAIDGLSKGSIWQHRLTGCLALLAGLLFAAVVERPVSAITIDTEYTDEGDTVPHDENPSWDPDGSILKSHFERAVSIWERLLPSEGNYEFDFHWDLDISGAGLTTDIEGIDTYIEINLTLNWFADPTHADDVEFDLSLATSQTRFGQLNSSLQTNWFPGTAPPNALEVGFTSGTGDGTASLQPGVTAGTGADLLSVILHEVSHVLGIGAEPLEEPGEFNIYPHHVGGLTNVLVKEDAGKGHSSDDGNGNQGPWLVAPFLPTNVRRMPSATETTERAAELPRPVWR